MIIEDIESVEFGLYDWISLAFLLIVHLGLLILAIRHIIRIIRGRITYKNSYGKVPNTNIQTRFKLGRHELPLAMAVFLPYVTFTIIETIVLFIVQMQINMDVYATVFGMMTSLLIMYWVTILIGVSLGVYLIIRGFILRAFMLVIVGLLLVTSALDVFYIRLTALLYIVMLIMFDKEGNNRLKQLFRRKNKN